MVPLRRSARLGASNSPALSGIVQSVGSAAGKDRSQDGHLATRGPNNKKGKSGASSSTRPEPPVKDEQQPVTPSRKRKRKRKSSIQASPAIATATPSAVRLMAASHVLGERDHATVSVPDRPAQPYKTNAPLVSSETSKIVAYQDGVVDPSPSKQQVLEAATTTGNILVRACAHLISVEPSLRAVIEKHHCPLFSPEGLAEEIDPFRSLASGIIAQQVCILLACVLHRGWHNNKRIHRYQEQQPNPSRTNSLLSSTRASTTIRTMTKMQPHTPSPPPPKSPQATSPIYAPPAFLVAKRSTSKA